MSGILATRLLTEGLLMLRRNTMPALLSSNTTKLTNSIPAVFFHQSPILLMEPGQSYRGRRQDFRPWQRGFWIREGERAQEGAIIVRQVHLKYHPGQHVGIKLDKTLYALEPGTVFVTSEIIDPDWSNPHVKEYYTQRKGQLMFKFFVHIRPDHLPEKFKMVQNI